jgi:predicted PurR-regulated permease PerM
VIRVLVLACVLALFLAYLVAPAARLLQGWCRVGRRCPPRWLAILVVYLVGGLVAGVVWRAVVPRWEWQSGQLEAALPLYADRALDRLLSFERGLDAMPGGGDAGDLLARSIIWASSQLKVHVQETLEEVREGLPHVRLLWIAPALSLFLLQTSATFRRTTVRVMPSGQMRWRVDEFLGHVNWVLAGYTRAQALASALVATATGASLALLKVPYALSLGLAAGVLELFPIVGPVTVALSLAFVTSGPKLVAALFTLGLLRFLLDSLVYPQLMGRRMHLPPLAVFLALMIGARVGGILGVALALPAVGVGAVAVRHWRDHRAIQQLVAAHALDLAAREAQEAAQAEHAPGDAPTARAPENSEN